MFPSVHHLSVLAPEADCLKLTISLVMRWSFLLHHPLKTTVRSMFSTSWSFLTREPPHLNIFGCGKTQYLKSTTYRVNPLWTGPCEAPELLVTISETQVCSMVINTLTFDLIFDLNNVSGWVVLNAKHDVDHRTEPSLSTWTLSVSGEAQPAELCSPVTSPDSYHPGQLLFHDITLPWPQCGGSGNYSVSCAALFVFGLFRFYIKID